MHLILPTRPEAGSQLPFISSCPVPALQHIGKCHWGTSHHCSAWPGTCPCFIRNRQWTRLLVEVLERGSHMSFHPCREVVVQQGIGASMQSGKGRLVAQYLIVRSLTLTLAHPALIRIKPRKVQGPVGHELDTVALASQVIQRLSENSPLVRAVELNSLENRGGVQVLLPCVCAVPTTVRL